MTNHLQFEFLTDRDHNTITVVREFAAGRQLVWDCHTKSQLLDQWFAPKPLITRTKSMDFRKGGHWHYAMIDPDGKEYWGYTEYQDVNPIDSYKLIDAFSDSEGTINTALPRAIWQVQFAGAGEHTIVTTVIIYSSLKDLETILNMGIKEGLTAALDRLDEVLEALNEKSEKKTRITVETTVSANPVQVWELWTNPDHITKWNFAIDSWHCPRAQNDLRIGGKYIVRMEAKDGSLGFDFEALYDEVIDQKKISYTMSDGRKATTSFEDLGGKTRITTIFDAEKQNSAELQKEGWQAIMNNFKKYCENSR